MKSGQALAIVLSTDLHHNSPAGFLVLADDGDDFVDRVFGNEKDATDCAHDWEVNTGHTAKIYTLWATEPNAKPF